MGLQDHLTTAAAKQPEVMRHLGEDNTKPDWVSFTRYGKGVSNYMGHLLISVRAHKTKQKRETGSMEYTKENKKSQEIK